MQQFESDYIKSRIMSLYRAGYSSKDIAKELKIELSTVQFVLKIKPIGK